MRPDGDALGSSVAMAYILEKLGKEYIIYNQDGMRDDTRWLKTPKEIVTILPEKLPSHCIVLDCGNETRIGKDILPHLPKMKILNIDHHRDNPCFGALNWVDQDSPSTGRMIATLALAAGLQLKGPIAEALYLAMATDTGFFTYNSATPECLELVAKMMREGLNTGTLIQNIRKNWTLERFQIWGDIFKSIESHHDGKLIICVINLEVMQRHNATREDVDGIIAALSDLKGSCIVSTIQEEGADNYKLSLRSHGSINVQEIAASFGGGGHKNAAGAANLNGLEAIIKKLKELALKACV